MTSPTWIRYEREEFRKLPEIPAVYVVFIDGRVAYVGETVALGNRIRQHALHRASSKNPGVTRWCGYSEIYIKAGTSRRYGDWRERELRLIRRLRPYMNGSIRNRREDRREPEVVLCAAQQNRLFVCLVVMQNTVIAHIKSRVDRQLVAKERERQREFKKLFRETEQLFGAGLYV